MAKTETITAEQKKLIEDFANQSEENAKAIIAAFHDHYWQGFDDGFGAARDNFLLIKKPGGIIKKKK